MYFKAKTKEEAVKKLFSVCGEIPENLLTWTVVEKVPAGQETLQ